MAYNTYNILPVEVSYWNKGVRVYSKIKYLSGDNAYTFNWVVSCLTRDTLDS